LSTDHTHHDELNLRNLRTLFLIIRYSLSLFQNFSFGTASVFNYSARCGMAHRSLAAGYQLDSCTRETPQAPARAAKPGPCCLRSESDVPVKRDTRLALSYALLWQNYRLKLDKTRHFALFSVFFEPATGSDCQQTA
jgi:hypothetical protein